MATVSRRKGHMILYRDPAKVAGAVTENNAGYGPGSAAFSPSLTHDEGQWDQSLHVHQMDDPLEANQGTPPIKLPRPPAPNVGGVPGRQNPLGYSIGLLPSRSMRQPFRGATMVRPSMGVHPATGPVGLSNRQGRLQAAVAALDAAYLPSNQEVRQMFTTPRNRNPLSDS